MRRGSTAVPTSTTSRDLFDTDVALEDEDEYDTVGGLIYHRIGGVPRPGDQVSLDGLTLTVEKTDGRRVSKVLVVRNREATGPGGRRGGPLARLRTGSSRSARRTYAEITPTMISCSRARAAGSTTPAASSSASAWSRYRSGGVARVIARPDALQDPDDLGELLLGRVVERI